MPPCQSFATQAHLVYRPVFFACGLSVVGGERTRPEKEWEGLIFRPTPYPAGHLNGRADVRRGPDQSLGGNWPRTPERLARALFRQLHPDVDPQVLHFMQVPLRTSV